jgi:phosphoglycerate dehydrogenase-like enzyme
MINIVFSDQAIFDEYTPYLDALRPLDGKAEITAYSESFCGEDERYERLKDADVVIFGVHKFDNVFLGKLKRLKMLQFMGLGYETFVDAEYCARNGIILCGIDDYGSNAVAEYAVAQMFALARNIARADRYMRESKWVYSKLEGMEIAGSTAGVLGTGSIGKLVAQKLSVLGAEVIANDICESDDLKDRFGVKYAGIGELFAKSDIVSVHVKYMPETRGLVSRQLINSMKSEAIFINTSRSEVVDISALKDALKAGAIRGAALDVFDEEPLTDFSICHLPNVITSPHIGYFTSPAKGRCLKKCVESVIEKLAIRT